MSVNLKTGGSSVVIGGSKVSILNNRARPKPPLPEIDDRIRLEPTNLGLLKIGKEFINPTDLGLLVIT